MITDLVFGCVASIKTKSVLELNKAEIPRPFWTRDVLPVIKLS